MRQAVIVSTARTPLTKSHRGEFNITPGPTLASFCGACGGGARGH
jgi:acetyl-CoA C-acetyltransferase